MEGFCLFQSQHRPVPKAILDYLSHAFNKYLTDGVPLEKGLGLRRPNHRPKGICSSDPLAVLIYVHGLMKRDGKSKQQAVRLTACEFYMSERQVERVLREFSEGDKEWKEWKWLIESMSLSELGLSSPVQPRK